MFLLFKVAPKCRAEVLATVRRDRRAVMCFRGKKYECQLTPVRAALCEFNVNDQLYIYIYIHIYHIKVIYYI